MRGSGKIERDPNSEDGQQADDHGEEGNAFHQGRGDDHVGADRAGHFRLAGDGLHGTATNLADTNAGANGAECSGDAATNGLEAGTSAGCGSSSVRGLLCHRCISDERETEKCQSSREDVLHGCVFRDSLSALMGLMGTVGMPL